MRRRWPIPLILLALLTVWVAYADEPASMEAESTDAIFEHFDHDMHDQVFEREGLGCTACHQVGSLTIEGAPSRTMDEAFLPPPGQACHYCHNPPEGEREIGPGRCALCHSVVEPPAAHGAGWIDLHGRETRVGALECNDCHRQTFCIDCHNRREALTWQVHDRTWISLHGIAARTDPGSCGTCHVQAECTGCHSRPGGRLP